MLMQSRCKHQSRQVFQTHYWAKQKHHEQQAYPEHRALADKGVGDGAVMDHAWGQDVAPAHNGLLNIMHCNWGSRPGQLQIDFKKVSQVCDVLYMPQITHHGTKMKVIIEQAACEMIVCVPR